MTIGEAIPEIENSFIDAFRYSESSDSDETSWLSHALFDQLNMSHINLEIIYGSCNAIIKPSADKFAMSLHSSF
jgi:hypothetical protein